MSVSNIYSDEERFLKGGYYDLDMNELTQKEKARLLRTGYQPLEDEIPQYWLEDVNTCPCVVEGNCMGIKDTEFIGRCVEGELGFLDCELYKQWASGEEPSYEKPNSQALKDTTIMHADEIFPNRIHENSIEEQVNEGVPMREFVCISKNMRQRNSGSYEEYNHVSEEEDPRWKY